MPNTAPTLVMVHALGGSGRWFDPLVERWDGRFEIVAPDLPGFGGCAGAAATDLLSAVDAVVDAIRRSGSHRFVLVGHSMGGKVVSLVAADILAGRAPVFGLAGVVLLAPSPPTPEPMSTEKRAQMLSWVEHGPVDAGAASAFVDANSGGSVPPQYRERIEADVRRAAPAAWTSWLRQGSRVDVSPHVGRLQLPSLVIGGDADDDLGAAAQPRLHGEVYPDAEFLALAGAGHLLPAERPREVADAVVRFWEERAGRGPVVPADVASLIASQRVVAPVRSVLARRALADEPSYEPQILSPRQLTTLRAVAHLVVPQSEPPADLAARVDGRLAAGAGDGWRPADLPDDASAYRAALDTLAGLPDLRPDEQETLLTRLAAGEHPTAQGAVLSATQLQHWFEDARHDLVTMWVTHPATAARLGFDAFADGGERTGRIGFTQLGSDERDEWEPASVTRSEADGTRS